MRDFQLPVMPQLPAALVAPRFSSNLLVSPRFDTLRVAAPIVFPDAISQHPFVHLTQKYGDVVVYRNTVYVPSASVSAQTLQINGVKKNLVSLGRVSDNVRVFKLDDTQYDPNYFCSLVKHYYQNPQLPSTDLLRYVDPKFRMQYVCDFFSQPFYFNQTDAFEQSTMSERTRAIFSGNGCVVAFEKKPNTFQKIADVSSTSLRFAVSSAQSLADTRECTYQIDKQGRRASAHFLTVVPEHKVTIEGKKYAFAKTTLTTKLDFAHHDVSLQDYPRVVDATYKHLFVYSDGQICYNGTTRFWDLGLDRLTWHSFIDNKLLPYTVARILEQGLRNLTQGYTPTCRPVNSPQSLRDLVVP